MKRYVCQIEPSSGFSAAGLNIPHASIFSASQMVMSTASLLEKIAHLFTIGKVRIITFEKSHFSGKSNLFKGFAYKRPHFLLMLFIWPKYIEVFKTNNSIEPFLLLANKSNFCFDLA